MTTDSQTTEFQNINRGYDRVFRAGDLSIGLVVPVENYAADPVPQMHQHLERVQLAEELGFAAVWLRDVPFNVSSFGDAGQTFDPFVYLGFLAAGTDRIALGVARIILQLRHPAHVAKAAATSDVLFGGRLFLAWPPVIVPTNTQRTTFRSMIGERDFAAGRGCKRGSGRGIAIAPMSHVRARA